MGSLSDKRQAATESATHLDEEIVAAGDVFHDVSLNFVILEDRETVVDQDWRMRRLKVRAKIGRRLLHVNCGHLRKRNLNQTLVKHSSFPRMHSIEAKSLSTLTGISVGRSHFRGGN